MQSPLFKGLGVSSGLSVKPEGNDDPLPLYKPKDTTIINLEDKRKNNPVTGLPFKTGQNKSLKIDQGVVSDIIAHSKANGIDPYTALAVSYQESGLDKNRPFNLNPDFYGKAFGGPEEGVNSLVKQLQYAKSLQNKGTIPEGEEFYLQGNNGYGKIKKGHQDLEGSRSIYGMPIPDEGIDFAKKPLYGKTIMSLRDEILKNNPQIKSLIENTPAYKKANKAPLMNMAAPSLTNSNWIKL